MLHQSAFTATVTGILSMQLWDSHMTFIDDEQVILREIIEKRERGLSRGTSIDVHGIVLDAVAITHLLHHL